MTLKRWVGTLLLTNCLGIVSLILLFVWGFGSGPKERQDYCKAMLIVKAILIVAAFIFGIIFSAAILSSASTFTDWAEGIADSVYTSAAAMFSFIG